MKFALLFALTCGLAVGETTVNGVRASNVLGGAEQHASFSFVRPGLTQTSYAFNGPSSHQSFSSSIGNPHLAQKVLPNVANALAYRNPGLGYFSTAPVATGYANSPYTNAAGVPTNASPLPAPSAYSYQQQTPVDQATALAYLQQYQQYQQYLQQAQAQAPARQTYNPEIATYQAQLGQHLALRQHQQQQQALIQLQNQADAQNQQARGQIQSPHHIPVHETSQEVPEQAQLQQQQVQQPGQNLLGVAYSSAPSVAHVKVTGNGYKFNF